MKGAADMEETTARLEELLSSLPVDTEYERGLLRASGAGAEKLLVAGAQEALPFSLLCLESPLFGPEAAPDFPVNAEYGESFSIRAVNASGAAEHYLSAEDFRSVCGARLSELRECTVKAPNPVLKRCGLRFLMLRDMSLERLNSLGSGCTGCILVAAADAGGFSEDYDVLCRWLSGERCIAERACVVLMYRTPRGNAALGKMAEAMLGRQKVTVVECRPKRESGLALALDAAVRDILDRKDTGSGRAAALKCCERTEKKLELALEREREAAAAASEAAERCRSAEKSFVAMAETDRYGLSRLLSEEENEKLRAETKAMFSALRSALPGLIDEAAAKSDNPKEDLRQLTGDYLGEVVNSFLGRMTSEVAATLLIPRTEERFSKLIGRFKRAVSEVDAGAGEQDQDMELDFLKTEGVNMGDYHTALADVLTKGLTMGVKLLITNMLGGYLDALGLLGLKSLLDDLSDAAQKRLVVVVDSAMPLSLYVSNLRKEVLKQMDEAEDKLCCQLADSVFPRLCSLLDEQYRKMTADYGGRIRARREEFEESGRRAEEAAANLSRGLHDLAALKAEL